MATENCGKNPTDTFRKHPILAGLTANAQRNIRRYRFTVSNHRQICDVHQPELTKEDSQFVL